MDSRSSSIPFMGLMIKCKSDHLCILLRIYHYVHSAKLLLNLERGPRQNIIESMFAFCCIIAGNSLNIKLSGGDNANEGKVEIYFNNTWGTVCGNGWDINDANVVCTMLGYSHALAARSSSYYGEGSGPIWLDNVDCTGLENSMGECSHSGWGVHSSTCNHGKDAAVLCSSEYSFNMILHIYITSKLTFYCFNYT